MCIFLYLTDRDIGAYGNADPLDEEQWLPLTVTLPKTKPSWSASTSICDNAVTGMHVKFLVAQTGEKQAPQNKIISALDVMNFN